MRPPCSAFVIESHIRPQGFPSSRLHHHQPHLQLQAHFGTPSFMPHHNHYPFVRRTGVQLHYSPRNNNNPQDLERLMERLLNGQQAPDGADEWKRINTSFQVVDEKKDWKDKLADGWNRLTQTVQRRPNVLLLAPLFVIAGIQLTGVAAVGVILAALLLASLTLPVFALGLILPLAFFLLFGALATPILPLVFVAFAPTLLVPLLFGAAFLAFQLLASIGNGPTTTWIDINSNGVDQRQRSPPGVIDVTAVTTNDEEEDEEIEQREGGDIPAVHAWEDLVAFDEKLKGPAGMRSLGDWTVEQVADAATGAGLGRFRHVILRHSIDGRVVQLINEEQIRDELGISTFGDRQRLLLFFEELRSLSTRA